MPLSAAAKLAITAALMAAQVAIGMSRKIRGPRLEDLSVTMADYGVPIPRLWGIRRLTSQIIWAKPLREKKKTSKTKGGKYSEYKYFGTWANLICDHEIDAVSKIFFDKKLIYQRTSAGPVSGAMMLWTMMGVSQDMLKLAPGINMAIYLGTETQMPDPVMEAWCEDRYGPDSCPAYRGSAYIRFRDIPLETVGNRLPQVEIEAINNKTDVFPYDTRSSANGLLYPSFTPDYGMMFIPYQGDMEVWDIPSRTLLYTVPVANVEGPSTIGPDGTIYADDNSNNVVAINDTGTVVIYIPTPGIVESLYYVGGKLCLEIAGSGNNAFYAGVGEAIAVPCGFIPTFYFEDADGVAWGAAGSGTDIKLVNMSNGTVQTVASPTTGEVTGALDNGAGEFLVRHHNHLVLIDKTAWTVTTSVNTGAMVSANAYFRNIPPGTETVYITSSTTTFVKEYDSRDLTLLRTLDLADWVNDGLQGAVIYDPINHALICNTGNLKWRYLDRVGSDGVTLKTIVDDVSDWIGLTGQDTAALTQTVKGYSIVQGTAKEMLEPLFDIHDVDPRPHDFSVQFVNRGSAPSGTLLTEDFVREGEGARYTVTIQQDTDLPRKLTYNFADAGKDQQTNNVISQREQIATDATREESIDLTTYVDTPDSAQRKADRHFRRLHNSRERISLGLTAQMLALEPGDVTTASLDGVLRNVRLDKMTISGSTLPCELVRDETSFAVLNNATGPEMEGRDEETIIIPSPTKGFVIDGPLIDDADNDINPIIYVAAGAYMDSWSGAGVYRGDDGEYDETVAGIDSSSRSIWGYSTDVLGTANHNLWDRGNSVNVVVPDGVLTSATQAEIDADPLLNLAAFGSDGMWEYLQFATATLEIDGSYTLSDFKRGRRGTENNVAGHAVGDTLVLLAEALPVELGTDDVGDAVSFKVQSVGRAIEAAPPIDMTFTGASLKPYAPALQSVTKETNGDLTIDFDRRTRIGGSWNGSVIPLGETTEEYELDVLDGSDVARTLTSTTSTITYTSAQQTTDFGAPIAANDLDAMLYQMSATVGRGFAASI